MESTCGKLNLFWIVLILFSLSKIQKASEIDSNTQQNILEALIDTENGYNPRMKPPTGVPEVNVSMYILDITDVDDFDMEFTMSCYFRQNWIDPRLRYDGEKDDLKYLHPNDYDKIWKPDLFFIEETAGKFHSTLTPNSFLRIKPNGEILYSARLTLTLRCMMDISMYPFDTQKCSFAIESYGYNRNELNLEWDDGKHVVSAAEGTGTHGFELKDFHYGTSTVRIPSGVIYKRLTVDLFFTRKIGFFLIKLYVPFIILVIVSWLSFWIKPKLVALRLALLLSIMTLMLYLASDVSNYVPPASYTKGIDVWTAVCISLVFAEFLEFIFISKFIIKHKHFHHNVELASGVEMEKNNKKDTELPISDTCLLPTSTKTSWMKNWAEKADFVSKWLFPILFGLFNIIYWSTYAGKN